MDIDFDLEDDQIGQFLKNKLKEIETINAELEKSCLTRQNFLLNVSENDDFTRFIKIEEIWKRVAGDKYVIGISVTNKSQELFENINVMLNWDSSTEFCYEVHVVSTNNSFSAVTDLLSEGLNWKNKFNNSAQILIVVDIPLFLEQLSYNVTGLISFEVKQKRLKVNFPSIDLLSSDLTDNSIIIQNYKIIEGNIKDFLTIAVSSRQYEFSLILNENNDTDLDVLFETYFALRKISLQSKKRFYYAHNICQAFDGSLIEINDDVKVKHPICLIIYCRSNAVLIAFIHYLHRQIINGYLIPRSLYCNWQFANEQIEDFAKCLKKELNCTNRLVNSSDKVEQQEILSHLLDVQHKNDLSFLKVNKKIENSQ